MSALSPGDWIALIGLGAVLLSTVVGAVVWFVRLEGCVGKAHSRADEACVDIEGLTEEVNEVKSVHTAVELLAASMAAGQTLMSERMQHLAEKVGSSEAATREAMTDIKHSLRVVQGAQMNQGRPLVADRLPG